MEFRKYEIISTMDSCFFYLAFHYGILVCIALILFLLKKVIGSLIFINANHFIYTKYMRWGLFALFMASFMTQGLMFTTFQGAFSYCLLLILIVKPI
jgi:hypothetical protein